LILVAGLLCFGAVLVPAAGAQANDTAYQTLALSAFGGFTGTYTGLYTPDGNTQGKNLGITAGGDLRVSHFRGFYPSVEVRGSFPVHKGTIDSEKNVLVGLRVERPYFHGLLHPYAGFLVGRGEIDYQGGGYYVQSSSVVYYYTVSNVSSPMLGMDVDLTHHFALKVDAQFVQYKTPVTDSGKIAAVPVTAGVVYKFDFNHHPKLLPDH